MKYVFSGPRIPKETTKKSYKFTEGGDAQIWYKEIKQKNKQAVIYHLYTNNRLKIIEYDFNLNRHKFYFVRSLLESNWYWLVTLTYFRLKNFNDPFLWMGFNCLKATEPLLWCSLLFTTKFTESPGTHLMDLGRMKGWINLGTTQWFWTGEPWIGNPAP